MVKNTLLNGQKTMLISVFIILQGCVSDNAQTPSDFTDQAASERAIVEFTDRVRGEEGEVSLIGWMHLRGEVVLYADKRSMNERARYPNCISGVFTGQHRNQIQIKLKQFDGQRVLAIGELVDYSSLEEEDRPVLARKILAGSVIPNWCYGKKVLLLKSISYP